MNEPHDASWPVRSALEILDEEGFSAVTLRAVAARADRTPMAVYRHVRDVEDLLRLLVRRVFEHWESRVHGLLEESDPLLRLQRYADVYAAYERDHPHRYDVLFVLPHGMGTRRFPDGFEERAASTFAILRDAVAEVTAEASPDDDPVELALGLWATVHGLVMLRRSGRFPDDRVFEAFYRRTVTRLLGDLAGPGDAVPEVPGCSPASREGEPDP